MVSYNNKLITVLSGQNAIWFSNQAEFDQFKEILVNLGCDVSKHQFVELLRDAQYDAARHNRDYKFGNNLVAGWNNKYGFQYGWKDLASCVASFGASPFTWKEIEEELR